MMDYPDKISIIIDTVCVAVIDKNDGITLPMEMKRKRFESECKKIGVSKKLKHHIYNTILQLNDK